MLDTDASPAELDPVVELLVVELVSAPAELLVLVSVDELVLLDVAMSPTELPTVVLEVVVVGSDLDVDLSVLLDAPTSVLVSDEELAVVLVVVSVLVEGEVVACVDDDSTAELDPVVDWLVLVAVGVLSLVSVRVSLLELVDDEVALLEEVAAELASVGLLSLISVRVSLLELVDVDVFWVLDELDVELLVLVSVEDLVLDGCVVLLGVVPIDPLVGGAEIPVPRGGLTLSGMV